VTRGGRRRRESKPLEDPDAEAFCRVYARIVLRQKGLAGLPRGEQVQEEVDRETA
jgi:hypothetical protein